jgi:hypothetical protein
VESRRWKTEVTMQTSIGRDGGGIRRRCDRTAAGAVACTAAVLALLVACNDEPSGLDAGADGPPIVVTAAQPRESGRGETMKVRITGTGFREGDEAVWERNGSTDDRVVVEKTEFVSATQLVATISIQADATIAGYDIAVSRPRKKGIGTEAFYVLHGIGSEFQARFSFTYDGYRSGSFNVDDTFVLDPATMDPGSWGLTYYIYEQYEQFIGAHYLRDDGLVDMMWCWTPGGRVTAPGTRLLECWFTPQYNFETGEYADPEDYTSFIGSDRPGDGTGRITFTSVTPERLAGTFSITMHVVDWPDWLGSPSITISDGEFDLPVVSSYYDLEEDSGAGGGGRGNDPPNSAGSYATAINDHGVVTGWARNARGEQRAVRWTIGLDGTVAGPEELGTIAGSTHQWPTAINNHGVITGYGYNADPYISDDVGFIYDGTIRALKSIDNSFTTRAFGINDHGVVVGWSYLTPPGVPTDLRGPIWLNPLDPAERPIQLPKREGGPVDYGLRINNHGVIAGFSNNGKNHAGAYRWQLNADGSISTGVPIPLQVVAGMNDAMDFVGCMPAANPCQPALLRGDSYVALGSMPAHDRASVGGINSPLPGDRVQIVGTSFPQGGTGDGARAVIWSVDTTGDVEGPSLLGHPDGFDRADPMAINAHGWVAGIAWNTSVLDAIAMLWLPRAGAGYDIVKLGGLVKSTAAYQAAGTRDVVRVGQPRCRARPGRPDRCR